MTTEFVSGITLDLHPFVGLIGTEAAGEDPVSAILSGPFGGNLVLNDLVEGSSVFQPVHQPGGGEGCSRQDPEEDLLSRARRPLRRLASGSGVSAIMTSSPADRLEILDVVVRADDFATVRDVHGCLSLTTEDMLLDGGGWTHRGSTALPDALAHIWSTEASGTRYVSVGLTVTDTDADTGRSAESAGTALTNATLGWLTRADPWSVGSIAPMVCSSVRPRP